MARKDSEPLLVGPVDEGYPLLTLYGWPEWPPSPGDIPGDGDLDWYKNGSMFVPESHGIHPLIKIFEINGLPETGKTSLLNALNNKLKGKDKLNGKIFFPNDEPGFLKSEGGYLNIRQHNPDGYIPVDYGAEDRSLFNFVYQTEKMRTDLRAALAESLKHRIEKPRLWVNVQGCADVLPWYYALAGHTADPDYRVDSSDRLVMDIFTPDLVDAQSFLSGYVNGVVLIGCSQEEAQKRRLAAGKKIEGSVAGSPFFNDLSKWYAYYVNNVAPRLHANIGTGLLVLNGENDPEENTQKVIDFITKQ